MASGNNGNNKSDPTDVKGNVSRNQTQSSSSVASDDDMDHGNRQCTTSQTFMMGGGITSASPPKFVTLEEIMQAAKGMKDMALVHQIVVDKDFKLQRYEPQPNSLHRIVKDSMHKAFWDILKQQLSEDPPNYEQAFILLEDIKNGLFQVLLPQHTKIKQQIAEVLDMDLIKQQALKGVLDFDHYAQYVISVMSKLCAPVRDDKIKALMERASDIDTFRGILETLDLMALDMANFTIEIAKPEIIAHSVELERKKFADYLSLQADGLEHTRRWLLKHVDVSVAVPSNVERISYVKGKTKQAFTKACIDLIEWDETLPFPETFILDQRRLQDLQIYTLRLIVTGTVLLITVSNVGDLQSMATFKETLKDHVFVLLQSLTSNKNLEELLQNVAEQVLNDVNETRKTYNLNEMSENSSVILKEQIIDISKPGNRIRQLVRQRIKEFFLQIIESSTADPQKVPSGLSTLNRELTSVAGQFLKIVSHNSTVFCIYYFNIVDAVLSHSE